MAMITTTLGELDESLLEKREDTFENDHEITKAVEYYKDNELVHRSVHVHLKKNVMGEGFVAEF